MKLYILRWNPSFSMKYENHLEGMKLLEKQEIYSNWSIYDHEDLENGDIFLFNMVGCAQQDGIAGIGTFVSDTYTEANWKRKDGANLFYADTKMEVLIDRRKTDLFCAKEMEQVFPEIDWHTGHAGVLVPSEIQEKLIVYIMKKLLPFKKPTQTVSFQCNFGEFDLSGFFASVINECCPELKAKIIERGIQDNKLQYRLFKDGEVIDKSMIEIAEDMFRSDVVLSNPCTEEELTKFFLPVA